MKVLDLLLKGMINESNIFAKKVQYFKRRIKSREKAKTHKTLKTSHKALWSEDTLTHLEFLSNTEENTSKKLSFASLLDGTELSKVGSTLLNARLFTGSDSIS